MLSLSHQRQEEKQLPSSAAIDTARRVTSLLRLRPFSPATLHIKLVESEMHYSETWMRWRILITKVITQEDETVKVSNRCDTRERKNVSAGLSLSNIFKKSCLSTTIYGRANTFACRCNFSSARSSRISGHIFNSFVAPGATLNVCRSFTLTIRCENRAIMTADRYSSQQEAMKTRGRAFYIITIPITTYI